MTYRSLLSVFVAVLGFVMGAVPVTAQSNISSTSEPIVATKAAPVECELHIWPAHGMNSMYFGWTHGSTVNGSAKGRNGYPLLPTDPLTPARQLKELATLRLPEKFGRPRARLVLHELPLPRASIGGIKARRSESTSSCYSELIVEDMFHENATFASKSLRVLFRFRDFGDSPTMVSNFLSWGVAPLFLFPPKDSSKMDEAINELLTAFRMTADNFAGNVLIKPSNSAH